MSFHDIRFPEDISYGAQGGPEFNTTVVISKSGRESRNQHWSEPRIKWDLSTAIKNRSDAEVLLAFFRARRGRAYGFRFKDHMDYNALLQPIGTGNGVLNTFQLVKTYFDGLISTNRKITRPVLGTTQIYLNGILQTTGWTINTSTGVVTFSTPPSNGILITASFEFDLPARFDVDGLKITIQGYDAYIADSINIIEIRE